MTIEEKARAYDEALEKAREALNDGTISSNAIAYLQDIFPELAESEDEWIRKALIEYFTTSDDNSYYAVCGVDTKKILAWLEKHDKPKKVSIWKHWKDGIAGGAEGEQIFLTKIGRIYSISSCLGCECDYIELSELDKLMIDEKPKWSDEDEELLQHCCGAIAAADYYTLEDKEEMENWLKTIKQRWRNEQ